MDKQRLIPDANGISLLVQHQLPERFTLDPPHSEIRLLHQLLEQLPQVLTFSHQSAIFVRWRRK